MSGGIRQQRREHPGAAATELVVILPILVALLLGLTSIGMAHYRNLILSQAAREAARFGATLPAGASGIDAGWLDLVAQRASTSAFGEVEGTVPGQHLCVAYVGTEPTLGSSTGATLSRVETAGVVSYPASPCYDDGRGGDERRVQVALGRRSSFDAFFFSRDLALEGQGVAAFEAVRAP